MTPPINQKTFNLVNRISKSFDLIIDNFAYAATLLANFRSRIAITISPTFALSVFSTINLRRIRLVISQMKLIVKLTQTISLRRVRLVISVKERVSNLLTILGRLRITAVSSARQKLVTSIIIRKIVLTIDPTLAIFFTLGDFDPDTLGTLDVLTLGEMDYTET